MAFSTNGVEVFITSRATREVIASVWMIAENIKVYDNCTTEVVEYRGMNETNAKAKALALRSNSMADYRIIGSGVGAGWIVVPNAKGTIVSATVKRQGDSRMFTVEKVTETHACSNSAGWTEY